MAFQFPNPTSQKRFDGEIRFEGHTFQYEMFITPLDKDTPNFNYVVEHIRSRRRKGERGACLGTTKSIITRHLRKLIASTYCFVREVGTEDEASGSLQVYDWFDGGGNNGNSAQAWVSDLCRWTKGAVKSEVSPIKVLFFLFSQLASHQLHKTELYLKVEPKNETVLCPLYEKYGFTRDERKVENDRIPMKKTIERDPEYANFPFYLVSRSSSNTKTRKRKTF